MSNAILPLCSSLAILLTLCPFSNAELTISCCSSSNASHCTASLHFSPDLCSLATTDLSHHPSCVASLNTASGACNDASNLHIRLHWPHGDESPEGGLEVGDSVYLVPKIPVSMCGSFQHTLQWKVGEYLVIEDSVVLNGDGDLAYITLEVQPQIPGPLELCRLRGTELTQLQVPVGPESSSASSAVIQTRCPANWFYASPDMRSNRGSPSCRGSAPSCAFATFHEDKSTNTWFESAEFCHTHGARQCSVEEVLAGVSREVFPNRIQSGRVWTSSRCSYVLQGEKHFGFYTRALHSACASPDCNTSHPNSYPGERCWHDGSKRMSCKGLNGGQRRLRNVCPENTDWRLFLKDSRNVTIYDFFGGSPGEGVSMNIPSEKLPGYCMSGARCGDRSSNYTVIDGGMFGKDETPFTSCDNFNSSDVSAPVLVNGLTDELSQGLLVRHGAVQLVCTDEFASISRSKVCCASQVPTCELCPFGLSSLEGAQHVSECMACVRACGKSEPCECNPTDVARFDQEPGEPFPMQVPDTVLEQDVGIVERDDDGKCPMGTYPNGTACLYCAQGFDSPNGSECVLCAQGCVKCGRISQCRCSSVPDVAQSGNSRRLSSCESLSEQSTCEDTVACAWSDGSCYTLEAPDNGCEVILKDFKCDAYSSCVWDESDAFCKIIGIPTSGCSAKTTSAKCTKFSLCSWTGSECFEISSVPSASPSEQASSAPSIEDTSTTAPSLTTELCATFQSELDCDSDQYCEWNSGGSACIATGQPGEGCGASLDEASCIVWSECWWDSGTCVQQPTDQPVDGCEVLLKEDKCNGYTECIWFDDQCMIIGKPASGCSAKTTDAKCNKFYFCTWLSGSCTDVEHTLFPTISPSADIIPTTGPSVSPSLQPTDDPSAMPTLGPSHTPTLATSSPVADTNTPTETPTSKPSEAPTAQPSISPTPETSNPSSSDTTTPSSNPTREPVVVSTNGPSSIPTMAPTTKPSHSPSIVLTNAPSFAPTTGPSSEPSSSPEANLTIQPSFSPSQNPTSNPSKLPVQSQTGVPTNLPTASPSTSPSEETNSPTGSPSVSPTSSPFATGEPTSSPSIAPSRSPSMSTAPTKSPSALDLNATIMCRCVSACVKGRCEVQSSSCLLSQPWLSPTFVAGGVDDSYGFFVPMTPVAWCIHIAQSASQISPVCPVVNDTSCPSMPYAYVEEADVMVTHVCEAGESCTESGEDDKTIYIRGQAYNVQSKGKDPLAAEKQCT